VLRHIELPLLGCVLAFSAVVHADQITLKNGDRVTGKAVKKDGDKLTFKSDHFGEITVPWEQIQDFKTDEPVTVVLSSGASKQTIVNTAGGQPAAVPLTDIKELRNPAEQATFERLQHPPWTNLWTGSATIGYAGAQGNAKTRTFTSGLTASRITRTDKAAVYFAAIRSSALIDGIQDETAQAVRGGWLYNHNISRRIFLNVFNDYEYDRFQNLDLRFVFGSGLGFVAHQSERARLDLLAGIAYNHEKFAPAAPAAAFSRNSAEAYFGDQWTYAFSKDTTIVQSFRMFPNLSDTGSYRMNFDLGANTRIFKWLIWNLAVSDRFLSNPVPGRQKNDLLYTTGIGVSFAH